ncbi:hypothetical protein [Aquimarina agarivorans]|uniref:hypothetical protein n=1 Tax=Aquimarina agarivorans TaxID=980584 RepID=UPI000248F8CC|nr:hypothetical protein [Aquimarina agarivorans]
MRKILFTLSLLSLLNFTSCGESFEDIKDAINNETLTPKTAKLLGSWQLESAVLPNGTDVSNSCFMEEVIDFNINGTYIDRRNQINESTGECEMVGEFIRGFDNEGNIFETAEKKLVIAKYQVVNKNELLLNFTIPFEATVTYLRIY